MKSSAKNIQMTSYDDLFGENKAKEAEGTVMEINLSELFPFKNHPFKILDDGAMQDMVESIQANGVLVPGIARHRMEGGYELIAGHRRKRASELAGKKTMPVIIRELDNDEAVLSMVDSNLQRENLLPSEKAWAYKMKLDALKHQGMKGASRQLGEKCSVDALSENSNDSARNIHRYIRLTELIPELIQMVDDRKLAFNPSVELSYLSKDEQAQLIKLMDENSVIPSLEQAVNLKKHSQEGDLDSSVMKMILESGKTPVVHISIKSGKLREYFPVHYTKKQMEEVIFGLLETWKTEHN